MPSNPQSERILVVNDEEAVREIVASMLTSAGYQYKPAADGLEALALLDSGEEFDLLLCNLMMPNLNGMELLERTKGRFPDMPFVLQTGTLDISVCLAAIRNGAYDYLLQPFVEDQLLATVRRALEYRRLKLENRALRANLEPLVAERTDQLQTAMANLERSYDITLEALGDALDLKDKETERHSRRVTAFTIAMARAMGLAGDQIRFIARGAFLHDLGKLAIPDAILRKPSRLTPDELVLIRQSPYRGYQMIKKIPFLADAAEIIYSHCERYDGTGYPRGLRGEEIPLGARVVAVASALDAITSDRPYRAAQSLQYAREEIERWWGRQFDPEVVKVFLEMPENIWVDLRKKIGAQT